MNENTPLPTKDFLHQYQQMINQMYEVVEGGWKLVRKHDKLTKVSKDIFWIEFKEDGTFKSKSKEPGLDRSLILSPFNPAYTWQTTLVTEILENKPDYVHFLTQNSEYELFKM
jgi:hypothetical protein